MTKAKIFEMQKIKKEMFEEKKHKEQAEAIRIVEQRYEDHLSKSARIVEDLGIESDPKIVKIGKIIDSKFLIGLKALI